MMLSTVQRKHYAENILSAYLFSYVKHGYGYGMHITNGILNAVLHVVKYTSLTLTTMTTTTTTTKRLRIRWAKKSKRITISSGYITENARFSFIFVFDLCRQFNRFALIIYEFVFFCDGLAFDYG